MCAASVSGARAASASGASPFAIGRSVSRMGTLQSSVSFAESCEHADSTPPFFSADDDDVREPPPPKPKYEPFTSPCSLDASPSAKAPRLYAYTKCVASAHDGFFASSPR